MIFYFMFSLRSKLSFYHRFVPIVTWTREIYIKFLSKCPSSPWKTSPFDYFFTGRKKKTRIAEVREIKWWVSKLQTSKLNTEQWTVILNVHVHKEGKIEVFALIFYRSVKGFKDIFILSITRPIFHCIIYIYESNVNTTHWKRCFW